MEIIRWYLFKILFSSIFIVSVGLWETRHFSQNQRFWKKHSNPTYRLSNKFIVKLSFIQIIYLQVLNKKKEREKMEISFQRAIKIDSTTNPYTNYKDHKVDPSTMEVINTMKKGYNSSIYDKETSRKIGSFLRAQLGDYDNKTGIYARRIEGYPYIFTGEEAKKARKINEEARKEMEELEARYSKGANSSMPLSEQVELESESLHRIYRQNILLRRDKKMLAMVEDGDTIYKPDTYLRFEMNDEGRLKRIIYNNYTTKNNGYVEKQADLTI